MNQTKHPALTSSILTPPEVRLLLLLSRPALTTAQRDMAAKLVTQVTQWPAFIDTATRKFVLPMVYQNLGTVPAASPPVEALQTMRELAMQVTSEMLRRQAAFDWFHAHCVLPSGVDYAYFKGPALAARFYPDPMQRFYRDVDILVPTYQRVEMLRRMRDQGCKIFRNISTSPEITDLDCDAALSDFLAVTLTPHVLTPQGLLVELHDQIDHGTALFDTDALVRDTVEVTLQRHSIRVLPDTAHIVFICYHHTRHFWNKLNWLADLDTVCADPGYDRSSVLEYARALKIDSTVRASLELHDLVSAGRHPSEFDRATPAVDLLRACVDSLEGEKALEMKMRKGWRMRALVFDWQIMPVPAWRRAWLSLSKIQPSFEDMRQVPNWIRQRSIRYICGLGFRFLHGSQRRFARMLQR